MIARVVAAFLACGRLKAGTPLEIASTPVSAVAPCENALSRAKIVIPATAVGGLDLVGRRHHGRAPIEALDDPDADQHEDRHHEAVGRDREERARLLRAAKVRQGDQPDEDQREEDLVLVRPRERRPDREHPRHDRHDDRHHVVEEQGGGGDQAGEDAQVLLADDVGAATAGVGANGLAVGAHHDRHQRGDREGDRHHVLRRRRGGERQREQDLARGVRDRGQGVGGEHGQREHLRQQRVLEVRAVERSTNQDPLGDRARRSLGCAAHRHQMLRPVTTPEWLSSAPRSIDTRRPAR